MGNATILAPNAVDGSLRSTLFAKNLISANVLYGGADTHVWRAHCFEPKDLEQNEAGHKAIK
jgi:hypothetical protein